MPIKLHPKALEQLLNNYMGIENRDFSIRLPVLVKHESRHQRFCPELLKMSQVSIDTVKQDHPSRDPRQAIGNKECQCVSNK